MKIAAAVIWYNPTKECINNISTYLEYIDQLYIIDNSNENYSHLLFNYSDEKIKYIPNYKNYGVAKSLNIACMNAISDNFDWILTMDQDSSFSSNIIEYIEHLKLIMDEKIGLVAPIYEINNIIIRNNLRVLTSGSILNLEIYIKIGGFLELLFIDEVDHEICYRMIENGYKVIQLENIVLKHELGQTEYKFIFNKRIPITNHNYLRRYYIIRNKLFVKKLYPLYTEDYTMNIIKDFIKVLIWEKDKYRKIKFMVKGIRDYKNKSMWEYKGEL